jgi:hypothetical protein
MAAPELSSRRGRAQSHGTHGSVRAHLGREVMSGVEKHVATLEFNSVRRRGPGPRDTWQHRSSPQQRHVVAPEPTSAGMYGLKLQLT